MKLLQNAGTLMHMSSHENLDHVTLSRRDYTSSGLRGGDLQVHAPMYPGVHPALRRNVCTADTIDQSRLSSATLVSSIYIQRRAVHRILRRAC